MKLSGEIPDVLLRIFAPEVFLPVQSEGVRSRSFSPEEKLRIAVLEDAVRCLFKGGESDHARNKRRDAEDWIFENGAGQFTFHGVCEELGLEPSAVRRALTKTLESKTRGKSKWRENVQTGGRRIGSKP